MLAITGGKSGVGKTTMGVAAALARAGRSPIALDADRNQPDLSPLAGVDRVGVSAFADGASAADTGERVDGVTVLGARPDPAWPRPRSAVPSPDSPAATAPSSSTVPWGPATTTR